jgi:hypothetical protein
VSGSGSFVRIIIRRPQAYEFKAAHDEAPIPGLVFLDGDGKVRGTHELDGDDAAATLVELMKSLK